jgi:hypothetical protein
MIRLLAKSELDKAKSTDKAREIAEGVKIARRVDALRELQSREESNLEKFRSETIAAIQAQVEKETQKRDEIASQVALIEAKSKKTVVGISSKQKELERVKSTLEKYEQELKRREDELLITEEAMIHARQNVEDALLRADTREEASIQLHRQATKKNEQASDALLHAHNIEQGLEEEKERHNREHQQFLSIIAGKEKELQQREKQNEEREVILESERILIADRKKMLDRALARTKQP